MESSSSEEEPFEDSGSEYCPSDPDVPGPSRRPKKYTFLAKNRTKRSHSSTDSDEGQQGRYVCTESRNVTEKKKGKKRVRNENNWKRNIMKNKKAKGEEYINTKKTKIPKKTTGPNCNCKKGCFNKITDGQKQNILRQFYALGDKNKQDIYLGGLISVSNVKRKRPTTGEGKEKNRAYLFKVKYILTYLGRCTIFYIVLDSYRKPRNRSM